MKSPKKTVAILGGSFDPVHLGHISIAEDVYGKLKLDEIWFVPSAQSPLKDDQVLDANGRLELLAAALKPYPHFKIDRSEIDAGGVSYTIDSARRFKAQYPEIEFCWIIGSDQFMQLDKWKDIGELCKLLEFIVVGRPGYEVDRCGIPAIEGLRFSEVEFRLLDIASSEIRERVRSGKPVNELLPIAVRDLIIKRNFYIDK